ncbi:MAG TPA: ABC transporter permease [Pseudonocardiaceae bacterium]|jgi:ABC-2 type transport system permease protein|nr:ABC transporter permease [Pseudonocardiaceae bacterium]
MGTAIKAEFRKVLTTKLWWALLIPSAAVAFLANLSFAAISASADGIDGSDLHIPLGYLSLGVSFSFTSIFASIFGALALAGENRHRTITTTYLTGARGSVLGAKLIVYGIFGLGYGVITLAFATLGVVIPASSNALPDAGSWLLISLVGIVVIALWAVLGVGLGGLISNQVAVVLTLPLYGLIGESLLRGLLSAMKIQAVGNYLPVQASSGSVISLALQRFLGELNVPAGSPEIDQARNALDATGLPDWWVSGLAFLAWTAVFCLIGWAISRRRDVT